MTKKRYKVEVNDDGMFFYDNTELLFMPITLEQIEILLNVQDKRINALYDENEQLKEYIKKLEVELRKKE